MSDGWKIPIVGGTYATISSQQAYDLVRHFVWHKCGFCGHVFRTVRRSKEGDYTIYMIAEILGTETADVQGACNSCPAIRD